MEENVKIQDAKIKGVTKTADHAVSIANSTKDDIRMTNTFAVGLKKMVLSD